MSRFGVRGGIPLFFLFLLSFSVLADNATCSGNCTINITQTLTDTSGEPLTNLYAWSVYGGLTLLLVILYHQMHHWKADRGASLVYGLWGGVVASLLCGLTFSSLKLFSGVSLIFDINYYFSVLYAALAIYGFAAGYFLYQDMRHDDAEEWSNPYG